MLTECEKAAALLANRRIKIKDVATKTGIPYTTIKNYSADPDKLRTAAWERVHKLSLIYDEEADK